MPISAGDWLIRTGATPGGMPHDWPGGDIKGTRRADEGFHRHRIRMLRTRDFGSGKGPPRFYHIDDLLDIVKTPPFTPRKIDRYQ